MVCMPTRGSIGSRGFSPLAVELLNARRAIDYLVTRRDLDATRIGATGRSGGGMTTFFLAALDDRIVASAPVWNAVDQGLDRAAAVDGAL